MTARSVSDPAAVLREAILKHVPVGIAPTANKCLAALAELVERLEAAEADNEKLRGRVYALETSLPENYREALEDAKAQVAALTQERDAIGAALGEPCAECGHIDWRSDGYADDLVARALADTRRALEQIERLDGRYSDLNTARHLAHRALAATGGGPGQEQQP